MAGFELDQRIGITSPALTSGASQEQLVVQITRIDPSTGSISNSSGTIPAYQELIFVTRPTETQFLPTDANPDLDGHEKEDILEPKFPGVAPDLPFRLLSDAQPVQPAPERQVILDQPTHVDSNQQLATRALNVLTTLVTEENDAFTPDPEGTVFILGEGQAALAEMQRQPLSHSGLLYMFAREVHIGTLRDHTGNNWDISLAPLQTLTPALAVENPDVEQVIYGEQITSYGISIKKQHHHESLAFDRPVSPPPPVRRAFVSAQELVQQD